MDVPFTEEEVTVLESSLDVTVVSATAVEIEVPCVLEAEIQEDVTFLEGLTVEIVVAFARDVLDVDNTLIKRADVVELIFVELFDVVFPKDPERVDVTFPEDVVTVRLAIEEEEFVCVAVTDGWLEVDLLFDEGLA